MSNCRGFRGVVKMRGVRQGLGLLLVAGVLAGIHGCTRGFYHRSADNEVNDILKEKDRYAEWKIEQYHVDPDPRARFADPNNSDRPPMPPDDETAWQSSPHPQQPGLPGVGNAEGTAYLEMIKSWDDDNRAQRIAAAEAAKKDLGLFTQGDPAGIRNGPVQNLFDGPVTNQQGFLLNMDQSIELGLVNSREYQSVREDLYLLALPVTLQRFSFAWQWAATENAIRQWAGGQAVVGPQNNWSLGSTASASKLFSTGALLTTAFANNTVFNFSNLAAKGFTSTSTINVDLVQPLLQGGGRAVTLEPLTQSERNLFYSIRAFARFREQFYSDIAFGGTIPTSLFAAAGITGSGVGGSPISTLAALGIASTDVSGQFRGYLPTLYRQLDKAVDEKYVADLVKALQLFEGFQEGGQVSPLQVDQVRSTLLSARNSVLKDNQDTNNAMDQLKLQLGVPANLPLVLDDAPGRPITRQLDRYYEVLTESNAAQSLVEQQDTLAPDKMRGFLLQVYTQDPLVRGTEFQKKLPAMWETLSKRTDKEVESRLRDLKKDRLDLLNTKTDLEMEKSSLEAKGQPFPAARQQKLNEVQSSLSVKEFDADLVELEQVLRRYESRPWLKLKKEEQRAAQTQSFRLVAYAGEAVLVKARNERLLQLENYWPNLPPTQLADIDLRTANADLAQEAAVQGALQNRWDVMNARAQVVDAWRQLAVTANALLGVLNVQYHLDTTTPPGGTQPLSFSSAAANQELIINAQLPLVRVAERNAYRAAIINYERARRNLMSLEDNIAASVRFDVRQLQLFSENFKIQKKVLESLYSQVENSLEVIVAPVDPDQLKATGTAGQANAAALTQQYLSALGSLNGAQTKMYDIWLSYLATRMQLNLDLERLPLDSRGVWIDESAYTENPSSNAAGNSALADNERGAAEAGHVIIILPASDRTTSPVDSHRPVRLLPPAAPPKME